MTVNLIFVFISSCKIKIEDDSKDIQPLLGSDEVSIETDSDEDDDEDMKSVDMM
jgi:hypothetical protein